MHLKEVRLSKNMTQETLSSLLGVTRTTVTMWENGKSMPNIVTLKKIAEVLNCKVEDLI